MELWVILLGWALAGGSPGPATLAISATAMGQGRLAGLALASGVVTGSALWGIAAALGMSAIMLANVWVFEVLRYAGAAYLLWLAAKSLRAAYLGRRLAAGQVPRGRLFLKGLAIHVTNPKAILSWGAIYAIALPADASAFAVWQLFGALILTSMLVFWGYGFLFSNTRISRGYARLSRVFDTAFGLLFGAAALRMLSLRNAF